MLKYFEDFESLLKAIQDDKNGFGVKVSNNNRFPVRFILLNSFSEMRNLVTKLNNQGVVLAKLEDYLLFDDGWLTWGRIIESVESLLSDPNQDSILAPFSEVLRFFDYTDLQLLISNIIYRQSNLYIPGRRVYLPLVGLDSQRYSLFNGFDALPDIWSLLKSDEPVEKIKLWLGTEEVLKKSNRFVSIENTKKWFEHWRQDDERHILCSANPIRDFFKNALPDSVFEIELIDNHLSFINKVLKISVPFEYNSKEKLYWSEFSENLINFNKGKYDFTGFFNHMFNCHSYSPLNFIQYWFTNKSDFSRWLLVRYTLSINPDDVPYLLRVLKKLTTFKDEVFVKLICTEIFEDEKFNNSEVEDRNRILDQIEEFKKGLIKQFESFVEDRVILLSQKEEFGDHVIRICNGHFEFEKHLFISRYVSGLMTKEILLIKYPELSNYLSDYAFNDDNGKITWLSDYVEFYRHCRVFNRKHPELDKIISVINQTENSFLNWYTSLSKSKTIIDQFPKIDRVIWFDGLGIEWIPLITNQINKKEGVILLHSGVARNDLPSSTENNRWEDISEKIEELDPKYIHNNQYSYPKSLTDQIKIVSNQIDKILGSMGDETIAVVSDHGYSFLPKFELPLGYKFLTSHEGRYSECNPDDRSDNNFIVWKSSNGKHYKVALRHNSLDTKPQHEVHGGCTPEEAMVPVFVISTRINRKNIIIKQITKEVSVQSSKVIFSIESDDDIISVYSIIKNAYKKLQKEGGIWFFYAPPTNEDKLSIELLVNGIKFGGYEVEINRGFSNIDLF